MRRAYGEETFARLNIVRARWRRPPRGESEWRGGVAVEGEIVEIADKDGDGDGDGEDGVQGGHDPEARDAAFAAAETTLRAVVADVEGPMLAAAEEEQRRRARTRRRASASPVGALGARRQEADARGGEGEGGRGRRHREVRSRRRLQGRRGD